MKFEAVIYRGIIQPDKTIRDGLPGDIYCYYLTKENSGYIIWRGSIQTDRDSLSYDFHEFESNRDEAIELTVTLVLERRK